MNLDTGKQLLPEFPRTPHLPFNPNVSTGDLIAQDGEASDIWTGLVNIEEKVDGASVGMSIYQDHPLIRNRDHILKKGYVKNTAAKKQFASIFNWFHEHIDKFYDLDSHGPLSVYGEWCVAAHGIHYRNLPAWFIAYDVYDYERGIFLDPPTARSILQACKFSMPRCFEQGSFTGTYDALASFANEISLLTPQERGEGIYIKTYNQERVLKRFKMVRPDFERGKFWNPKQITKNILKKPHEQPLEPVPVGPVPCPIGINGI